MTNIYPTVSVIIPIYKVEKYINDCINSIVNQSYKKLEIILIDDGSPDSSGQIAEAWSQKDSRIKVIHQQNSGLSAARNTGIDACHGDWLVFVDSDDYVATDYIEKMLNVALHDKTKLVISNYLEVDESSKKKKEVKTCDCSGIYDMWSFWKEFDILLSHKCSTTFLAVAWDKLYSKDIFKNIRFKQGILNEDEEIMYSVIKAAGKISIINDFLYFYRVNRPNSIMAQESMSKGLRPQYYRIFLQRSRNMISDGLYDAAVSCIEFLISVLTTDFSKLSIKNNRDRNIVNNLLKEIKNISFDLKSKKVKLTFKTNLYIHFPFIICICKKIRSVLKS